MGKPWVGNGTWHFQYVANQRAICTWILVLSAKDWFVATDISRINVVNPMPLESWRIYGQFCWYWAWSMALRLPHWHEVELIVNYQESGWNDSNLNTRIFDGQTTIRIMAYSTGSRTQTSMTLSSAWKWTRKWINVWSPSRKVGEVQQKPKCGWRWPLFWTEPICFNNDGQVPVPPDLRPGNEPDPDFCWNALVVNPCDLYLNLYNVGPGAPPVIFLG